MGRSVAPSSPHLSLVGLLPHFAFVNDVDIPFEKYLLDLIGFYLEMDGEYLPPLVLTDTGDFTIS